MRNVTITQRSIPNAYASRLFLFFVLFRDLSSSLFYRAIKLKRELQSQLHLARGGCADEAQRRSRRDVSTAYEIEWPFQEFGVAAADEAGQRRRGADHIVDPQEVSAVEEIVRLHYEVHSQSLLSETREVDTLAEAQVDALEIRTPAGVARRVKRSIRDI